MNHLADIIREEIQKGGPLSFRRFMELALYHPEHGYYERTPLAQTGREGDFYTSVSVGPVFGELLARFIIAQWPQLPDRLDLVEAGAHSGDLAKDILNALQALAPELLTRTTYRILDPSPARRQAQTATLGAFGEKVKWSTSLEELRPRSVSGMVFCNELLDAFPVHRIGWCAEEKGWFEWLVDWKHDVPVWYRTEPKMLPPKLLPHLPSVEGPLAELLPDGFTTEICPGAMDWWRTAALSLASGWLLTFDYGLESLDFLTPERYQGTLRAYRQHRLMDDPLADPGEQDLTAHVDFTAIRRTGEAAGLLTRNDELQARFLSRILANASASGPSEIKWSPAKIRQFQTLTHPDHLGRSFRVLAQQKPE